MDNFGLNGVQWSDVKAVSVNPVKPYDAEVEYLESTGTQRIDTGIVPQRTTGVILRGTYTAKVSGQQICAARTGTGGGNRFFVAADRNGVGLRYSMGNSQYAFVYDIGVPHIYELNREGTGRCYIDDALVTTFNVSDYSVAAQKNLMLFATSGYEPSYGYSKARIWYVKIYNGSTLVRDLIPVRVGTTGYLFDRISWTLFGNAGTGSFLYGADLDGN